MRKQLKVLISHVDLDGYGANILFRYMNFDNVMIYNFDNGPSIENGIDVVYEDIRHYINSNFASGGVDVEIFIVDICPSREMLTLLAQLVCVRCIYVFDHHMTNQEKTIDVDKVIAEFRTTSLNDRKVVASGTSIFYDFLNEKYSFTDTCNYISTLVRYISCYDTYEWKKMGNEGLLCKELNVFFNMFENKEAFVDYMLTQPAVFHISPFNGLQHVFNGTSQLLVRQKMLIEQSIIDSVLNDPNSIYRGIILQSETGGIGYTRYKAAYYIMDNRLDSISEVGNQYLVKNVDIDVFVGIDLRNKTLGFRTIDPTINTAEFFAKPLDGGGHPKASGAPLPENYVSDVLEKLIRDTVGGSFVDK